jgi:hypothetical protein
VGDQTHTVLLETNCESTASAAAQTLSGAASEGTLGGESGSRKGRNANGSGVIPRRLVTCVVAKRRPKL